MKERLREFDASFQSIDADIRAGKGQEAKAALERLWKQKIPRECAAEFATLTRRANLISLGLKLLHPIIRPERGIKTDPTVAEIVEYASCLIKIGANEEAGNLLDKIDEVEFPKTLLSRAFLHMNSWEYAETIPLLKKFLNSEKVSSYEKLVGKVNLAASLIYERQFEEAKKILQATKREAQEGKLDLILGNCLELSAGNFILQKNWKEAQGCLSEAKALLKSAKTLDEYFVRKWEAILELQLDPRSRSALDKMKAIRQEAVERQYWEGVRECDRYCAVILKDQKLGQHLYFGTPYDGYRNRLITDFDSNLELPELYAWEPGKFLAPKGAATFNLLLKNSPADIGGLLLRIFYALASDFYRPVRVATLHYRCYPNEFYDPNSSPARIHVAVGRLRTWLKSEKVPIGIHADDGMYRLVSTGPCSLLVPKQLEPREMPDENLIALQKHWPRDYFTARDASEFLGKSPRTVVRSLAKAMEAQQIERSGKRVAAKYRFRKAG